MAGGFKIPFLADVAGFIKGTDSMADSLEDVADSLDDLGKKDFMEPVEDGFKDAGKEADKLEDKVSDAFKKIADDSRKTGKGIGDDVKDGTRKAEGGMKDLKEESASTAKEAAASFSSIEDAAGAAQEVVANMFVGFGPAGMAAGLIAAAGIGLGMSALTDHADKVTENKEKMLDLAQTIRDNGGALTEADYVKNMEDYGYAIQDTKEWFEVFQADAVSGFEKLRKLAEETGLSTQDIFKGGFGNKDEAVRTLELVQRKLEDLREKKEAVYNLQGSIMDPVDEDALSSLEESERLIKDNIKAQEDAEAVERDRKQSIEGTTAALSENIEALDKQADAVRGSISAELDYMDNVDDLNEKLETNGATMDRNTAAGRDNERAVLDQAAAINAVAQESIEAGATTDEVTKKFNAQKDALVTQLTPAFGGSEEAARRYIDQVLKTPPEARTEVKLTGEETVKAKLRELATPIGVLIKPEPPSETYFQSVLRGLSGRSVPFYLTPRQGNPVAP